MKKKETKLIIFILILLSAFILFLVFLFKPHNYTKEYKRSDYNIEESYDKESNYYTFIISKDNIIYPYQIKSKYLRTRSLIDEIKITKNDNDICILPISEKIEFTPLCSNKEVYSPNTNIENLDFKYPQIDTINKEYKDININYLNNKSFLLYNYKGFYLINSKTTDDIQLFNKDVYNIDLYYDYKNYLLIPNYNSDYYYNKLYVINKENGKVEEIKYDGNIFFDSMFLGDYKNKIYLLDKKEEKEYEINLKKEEIKEVPLQVLENKKLVEKRYREIINNNLTFYSATNEVKYELKDGKNILGYATINEDLEFPIYIYVKKEYRGNRIWKDAI